MPQILEPFEPSQRDVNKPSDLSDSTYEKLAKKFKKPLHWARDIAPALHDSFFRAAKAVGYETRSVEQRKIDDQYFEEIFKTHEIEASIGYTGLEPLDAKAFLNKYPKAKTYFVELMRQVNYEYLDHPSVKEWMKKDPTQIPFEKREMLQKLDEQYQFPKLSFPEVPILPDSGPLEQRINDKIAEMSLDPNVDHERIAEIKRVETSRAMADHLNKLLDDAPGDKEEKYKYVQKKLHQSVTIVEEWADDQQKKIAKGQSEHQEHMSKLMQLRGDIHDKFVYPEALRLAREGYMRNAELLAVTMPYDSLAQHKLSRIFGLLNIDDDDFATDIVQKYELSIGEDDIEWTHSYPPPLHTYEELPLLKEYLAPEGEPWYEFLEDETVIVDEDWISHSQDQFLSHPKALEAAKSSEQSEKSEKSEKSVTKHVRTNGFALPQEFTVARDEKEKERNLVASYAYLMHQSWDAVEEAVEDNDAVSNYSDQSMNDSENPWKNFKDPLNKEDSLNGVNIDAYFDQLYEQIAPTETLPPLEDILNKQKSAKGNKKDD